MQAALVEHPGLKRLLSGVATLAAQWGAAAALEALDAMAALNRELPKLPVAGKKALDALCLALARGAAHLGPDGLVRATSAFVELKHPPAALLAEAPLKAIMRGEAADSGASALLELLLTLAAGKAEGGHSDAPAVLPESQSEGAVRALLDSLPRLSPPTLAAVLASFPKLGLGPPGNRLLARLSAEYARRPVPAPPITLLLAVLRGVAVTATTVEAAGGGGGAPKSLHSALLGRLWDQLQPQLPRLDSADLVAATVLLARLGCLAPTTPFKARAREAVVSELRRRLGPDALQGELLASLPKLLRALQRGGDPHLVELAGEALAALQDGLACAAAGTLWRCALEAASLGLFRASGPGSEVGEQLLQAAAPKLAGIVSAAAAAEATQRSSGGGTGSGGGAAEGAAASPLDDAGAPDLTALAAILSAWNSAGETVRCHSRALLAWLDLPCIIAAAFPHEQQPLADSTKQDAQEVQAAKQQQPDPLDWPRLAGLVQGVVDALSHAAGAWDPASGAPEPPAAFVAACVRLVEAQGPKAAGDTGGAAACSPADAVTLLWTLSVLGGLGLATWDVLAASMDVPGAAYSSRQRSRVFEAHALILLRLNGVTQLATPAGELLRCREAYWESTLLPSAVQRATLAGALARASLLPPSSGVTVPAQGHWLLVDCVDPGSQIAWTFAPLRPLAVRLATRAALLLHGWEQAEVAADDLGPGAAHRLEADLRTRADAAHAARDTRLVAIISPLRALIEAQRAAGAGASVAHLAALVGGIDTARAAGLVPTVTSQQLAIMRQIANIAGAVPSKEQAEQTALEAAAAWEVPDSPVPAVPTALDRWDAVDVFLAAHADAATGPWWSVERLLWPPAGQTPPPPANPELLDVDVLALAEAAAQAVRRSWQPEREAAEAGASIEGGAGGAGEAAGGSPPTGGQRPRRLSRRVDSGSSSGGGSSSGAGDGEQLPPRKRRRPAPRRWRESRSRSRSRSRDSGITTDGEEEGEAPAPGPPVEPQARGGAAQECDVPTSFAGREAHHRREPLARGSRVGAVASRPARRSRSRSRSAERSVHPNRSTDPSPVGVSAASAWAFGGGDGAAPRGEDGARRDRKARRAAAAVAAARASLADSRGHQPVSAVYAQQLLSMLDAGLEEGAATL